MANFFNTHGSNNTIYWEAEPATRGTFTLLSTCLVTLSLCVWSCVHLNLPAVGGDWLANFLRRLAWILGALLIPEYLIIVAWSQRHIAKRISNEVNKTFKSNNEATTDPESQPLSRQHPWTMTHSFWVIMGGVAIDPGDSDSFIPESKRSTLTPNGISLLLKHEPQLLPDISEEDVKDKSKGSSFTKFVACIQAAWFCLSCIARLSQKLPVSMLEINTFAHACCSVIVYILWWRKPMDVERPLVVQADGMRQLLAYMWMASKTSCIPKPASSGHERITVGRDPEFEAIIDERTSSADGTIDSRAMHATPMTIDSISPAVNVPSTGTVSGAGSPTIKITTTQDLPGTGFRVNGQSTRWKVTTMTGDGSEGGDVRTDVYYKPAVFNLTPCDVRRWQLAREAIDKYRLKKPNTNLNLVTVRALPESVNLDESTGEGEEKPNFLACLGLSLVGAGYGGLHALAWNAHFPSHKELKLWRISVLIIAAPAALVFLFFLLSLIAVLLMLIFWFNDPKTDPNPKKPTEMPPPNTSVAIKENSSTLETISELLIGVPLGCAVIFLYLPARGYLVYESFRTVFFLPAAAYATTNWLQYFPHIT